MHARRDVARAPGVHALPRLRKDRMLVQQLPPNPRNDLFEACAALEVREHEWPLAAHQPRVARHDVEARADMRGEIDLVDHEEIRTRDAGTSLARDLVAPRDVDDVYRRVDQLRAEASCKIVATRLQKYDVQIWVPLR